MHDIQGVFTEKLILARLGVSRPIYVAVDSPKLGFPYFNFLGGYQLKKTPCIFRTILICFQEIVPSDFQVAMMQSAGHYSKVDGGWT